MLLFLFFFKITVSDYFQISDLLTAEDQAIRMRVRQCMEKEIAPIMAEVFFFLKKITSSFSFIKCLNFMFKFRKIYLYINCFWRYSTGRRRSFRFMLFRSLVPWV
jgi:hypothetical protein